MLLWRIVPFGPRFSLPVARNSLILRTFARRRSIDSSARSRGGGVARPVGREHRANGLLELALLLLEIGAGAAPFLGGIRGQFESIDGEELLADEPQGVTDQQHFLKESHDLL